MDFYFSVRYRHSVLATASELAGTKGFCRRGEVVC